MPPVVVVFVFTPVYLRWTNDPTDANLALLVAANVGLVSLVLALMIRLLRILRREPVASRPQRVSVGQMAKLGLALVVFGAFYLLAVYAVVFGLWPLHESSEAGAIAMNLILLAVLIGLPIAFYFGLKALGFRHSWAA